MRKVEVNISNEAYVFAVWSVRVLGYDSPEEFLQERLERYLREDMQTTMIFDDEGLTAEERELIRERDWIPEKERYYEDEGGGIWPPSKRPDDDDPALQDPLPF